MRPSKPCQPASQPCNVIEVDRKEARAGPGQASWRKDPKHSWNVEPFFYFILSTIAANTTAHTAPHRNAQQPKPTPATPPAHPPWPFTVYPHQGPRSFDCTWSSSIALTCPVCTVPWRPGRFQPSPAAASSPSSQQPAQAHPTQHWKLVRPCVQPVQSPQSPRGHPELCLCLCSRFPSSCRPFIRRLVVDLSLAPLTPHPALLFSACSFTSHYYHYGRVMPYAFLKLQEQHPSPV